MAVQGQSLCLLGSVAESFVGNVGLWPLHSRCEIIFYPVPFLYSFFFTFVLQPFSVFLLSNPPHTSTFLRPPPVPFPTPNPPFLSGFSLFSPTTLPLLLFPCLATVPLHLFQPILLSPPIPTFTLSILSFALFSCRMEF